MPWSLFNYQFFGGIIYMNDSKKWAHVVKRKDREDDRGRFSEKFMVLYFEERKPIPGRALGHV